MTHKRTIILTEDENIIFRHDNNNINGNDYIELDIVKALSRLEDAKIINIKKLLNLLKVKTNNIDIIDSFEITKDILFKNKNSNWKIIPIKER